jgi:hypothetical protein
MLKRNMSIQARKNKLFAKSIVTADSSKFGASKLSQNTLRYHSELGKVSMTEESRVRASGGNQTAFR